MQHQKKLFHEILKERLEMKNLKADQLVSIMRGTVKRSAVYRWLKGNPPRRSKEVREGLLRCIKPLAFQDVNDFEQFLEAAGQPVLSDEERQKYFPHSEIESPAQPKPTLSNNEERQEQSSQSPMAENLYPVSEELAEVIFVDYIEGLFTKLSQLNPYPVMLLLTQTKWDEPPCRKAILVRARQRYSPGNVLHIRPPYSSSVDVKDYFAELGKQCGMENVKGSYDFEQALKQRLTTPLFLLVSHFEKSGQSLGEHLAGVIRGISETYSNRLHVMLWGGKNLEGLTYKEGELSLLRIAQVEWWPELGRAEVDALWKYRFNEPKELGDDLVDELLKISGRHPQLLNKCLGLVQRKLKQEPPTLNLASYHTNLANYHEELSQCDEVWRLFTPFAENQETRQQVCQWLEKQDKLANWLRYIVDDLLQELYWKNLLVWRENNGKRELYWRCEVMRMAGKEILDCNQQ